MSGLTTVTWTWAQSAETSQSYQIDKGNRPPESVVRSVQLTDITSGDTVAVDVSMDGSNWTNAFTLTSTTTGNCFQGPWKYVRGTKAGTNGTVTAVGIF